MAARSDGSSSTRDGVLADTAVPPPRVAPADEPPAVPEPVPVPRAARLPPPRPRIVDEPGILGLSRLTRSRFGSRLFNLFFVLVFALIVVQMIYAILDEPW